VPAASHAALLAGLEKRGVMAATIGRATESSTGTIVMAQGWGDFKFQISNFKFGEGAAASTRAPANSGRCCCGGDEPAPARADARQSSADSSCCCGGDEPAEKGTDQRPANSDCCCCSDGDDTPATTDASAGGSCCCAGPADTASARANIGVTETSAGSASEVRRAFGAFMRASAAGGAVDERTKELINFALVVMSRCAPCMDVHLAKARQMGLTSAQLEEAAWCAIAMGGAPVKMFYEEAIGK
jgi:AhpD family alkylhydroperoxidase